MALHKSRSLLAACLCLGGATDFAEQARSSEVVYLGPRASDHANGASPASAVATLQAALDLAGARLGAGVEHVTIVVLPGRYVGQHARTEGANAGHSLTITGGGAAPCQTVFDGDGHAGTWLDVAGRASGPANLTISGLTITRYSSAISLNGSRDDLANSVSHVSIQNNVFDTIGQGSVEQGKPSTAVIRLVNGDDNRIIRNRFIHSRNLQACNLLHAVYVAHNSTGNLIKDNVFEDGCGDSIRFRDASGNNVVRDNRFVDAWTTAPITDWYCDSSSRTDCTKRTPECPSFGNRQIGNEMSAQYAPDKGLTAEFGDAETKMCPAPVGAKRFISQ